MYLVGALLLIPPGLRLGGVPPMLTDGRQKIKQTLTFFSVEREALANRSDGIYVVLIVQADQAQDRADRARRQARSILL